MSDTNQPAIEVIPSKQFSKWVRKAKLAAPIAALTAELVETPTLGEVIPGYGGLRKVRMGRAGRGKRGGFRVVYTMLIDSTLLILLDGYSKSEREDLSADELADLLADAARVEAVVRAEREKAVTEE